MVGLEVWPYGVQGIFYFIPPYGVNGRCIIYGEQGIFYFIPPYGAYGRCIIFGPIVYRAFVILFRHTVLMVGV